MSRVREDEWIAPSLCDLHIFAYSHNMTIILWYLNCFFRSPSLLFNYNVLEGGEFNLLPYPLMLNICCQMDETVKINKT